MDFAKLLSNFEIGGEFVSCEPYGSGLINRTYAAVFTEGGKRKRYIVQRINTVLFKNVDGLMNNIRLVTEFNRAEIEKRNGDPDRESLTLVFTKEGKPYYRAENGDCYRVYVFIEDAKGYDVVEKPEHFYESAVAFGKFAMLLDRFDSSKLFEVLPDFHNTVKRFANFRKSLEADKFNLKGDDGKQKEALEQIQNEFYEKFPDGTMESRMLSRSSFYELYGGLFFIGIYLGSMFIMATVLIIYYKLISEGFDVRERYQIMQKVGMSKKEVKRSIRSQVLSVFFLPVSVMLCQACLRSHSSITVCVWLSLFR